MQEHESLPRNISPREHISAITDMDSFTAGSRVVGFGLSRRQVDSSIELLNPGARARLLLAIFSIRNVNALVLDEPTNHLDEEAVMELTATLNTYEGTVVIVSHDRHFLQSLQLTKIFSMSPSGVEELQSVDSFVEVKSALNKFNSR